MYNLYTSEDAVIETENTNQNKNNMANEVDEMEDDFEQDQPNRPKGGDEDSIDKEFIDPFNREEPIVRDYTKGQCSCAYCKYLGFFFWCQAFLKSFKTIHYDSHHSEVRRNTDALVSCIATLYIVRNSQV